MSNAAIETPLSPANTFVPKSSPLAPHVELTHYYEDEGDEKRGQHGARPTRKRQFLRQIFDATAGDYDTLESILALGSGRWYRRQALRRAGLCESLRVLDVASGTGLVAREAIGIVGPRGRVFGVDPSIGMLSQARKLGALHCVLGAGEALPFADASFDFISMGYALRHLPDLRVAFAEFHRVLKPRGRLCVLEISRPNGAMGRRVLDAYFRLLLPIFARVMTRSPQTQRLWQYYWETIDLCVAPNVVIDALGEAGFADAKQYLSLGLFSEFTALKSGT